VLPKCYQNGRQNGRQRINGRQNGRQNGRRRQKYCRKIVEKNLQCTGSITYIGRRSGGATFWKGDVPPWATFCRTTFCRATFCRRSNGGDVLSRDVLSRDVLSRDVLSGDVLPWYQFLIEEFRYVKCAEYLHTLGSTAAKVFDSNLGNAVD
jgi:hypothetical protein